MSDTKKYELTLTQLTIIAMVTDALFIICASLGIWLANSCDHWSSDGAEKAVKGVLITFLVLAVILPIVFLLYVYKDKWISKIK